MQRIFSGRGTQGPRVNSPSDKSSEPSRRARSTAAATSRNAASPPATMDSTGSESSRMPRSVLTPVFQPLSDRNVNNFTIIMHLLQALVFQPFREISPFFLLESPAKCGIPLFHCGEDRFIKGPPNDLRSGKACTGEMLYMPRDRGINSWVLLLPKRLSRSS